jgi:hypothetical protein
MKTGNTKTVTLISCDGKPWAYAIDDRDSDEYMEAIQNDVDAYIANSGCDLNAVHTIEGDLSAYSRWDNYDYTFSTAIIEEAEDGSFEVVKILEEPAETTDHEKTA